jgi:hypothetical protein
MPSQDLFTGGIQGASLDIVFLQPLVEIAKTLVSRKIVQDASNQGRKIPGP